MTGGQLAEALRSGRRVLGTAVLSPSPHWLAVVAKLPLDFVFLDTEHIALDRQQLAWMCQAYKATGLAPIVRIPEPDPFLACMALDGGAVGIVAPYIETPEQVQALRGATKLRPLKGRRLAEALADETRLEPELQAFIRRRNADHVLIANIESVPALDGIEAILAVPGLDAVLVGPHDMTTSLGIPEQYADPRFDAAFRGLIAAARRRQVGVGVHFWTSPEQELVWAAAGANLILHSSDLTAFAQTMDRELTLLRQGIDRLPQP